MALTWENYQALILGAAGLALTAAPALNRARRRHRVRTRLKQDLELIEAAEKANLGGNGAEGLRRIAELTLAELAAYEERLRRRANIGRSLMRAAAGDWELS